MNGLGQFSGRKEARYGGIRNHAGRRSVSHVEPLERRQMMSAAPAAVGAGADVSTLYFDGREQQVRGGEWILGVNPKALDLQGRSVDARLARVERMIRRRGGDVDVTRHLGGASQYLLELPEGVAHDRLLDSARKLPGFRYLQPNRVLSIDATPNDAQFDETYGLHNTGQFWFGLSKPDADIDAPEAWDVTRGSEDVVVGVIDTGIDYNHPDLAANMWRNPGETPGDGVDNDRNGYVDDVYGIDAANDDADPMDDQDHGTHCAGTIGAVGDNGVGVAGVNWRVKIMALKFLTAEGTGSYADAVECINYATMMRQRGVNIKLTSNSWGGSGEDEALADAIAAHERAGLLFVAAAGNQGIDNDGILKHYPAAFPHPSILTVAATDCWDSVPHWSNYGATTVDLGAPGVDVLSTTAGGGYQQFSGTSMAAPHVAGVAALAWSLKPTATWQEVRDAITSSTDPLAALAGKVVTGGRINALGTLRALAGGTPNSIAGRVFVDANHNGTQDPGEPPMAGATVFLDGDDDGVIDQWATTPAAADVPVSIPSYGKATSVLNVSGRAGLVTDVDVTLDIAHTYQADLHVYLISPTGQRVKLFGSIGTSADNFTGTTLDDEAATPIGEGTGVFTGRFRPQGSLSDLDGSNPNGTWTLEVEDAVFNDEGSIDAWSLRLTVGEQTAATGAAGGYVFTGLTPGEHVVRQVAPAGYTNTAPPGGAHRVTLAAGQAVTGRDFGNFFGVPPARASVVGRHLFYNGSRFDGGDTSANAADDGALAANKSALRPGDRAAFANISGYTRGINGIFVDVADLPQGAGLSAADFDFAVGNDDDPANWAAAPAPASVAVRRGAGAGGSDRVTLAWSDARIRNTWLRVTVKPTAATGLAAPDVFYFGSLVGYTGRGQTPTVTAVDLGATRVATLPPGRTAPLTSPFDHNRDGAIDARDAAAVRSNHLRGLRLIQPGGRLNDSAE